MLYQLINETLVRQFPNYIEVDGVIYTNEAAREKALESGEWFELEVSPVPQYDEETQYITRRYYQEEDIIYCEWQVHEKENVQDANVIE